MDCKLLQDMDLTCFLANSISQVLLEKWVRGTYKTPLKHAAFLLSNALRAALKESLEQHGTLRRDASPIFAEPVALYKQYNFPRKLGTSKPTHSWLTKLRINQKHFHSTMSEKSTLHSQMMP